MKNIMKFEYLPNEILLQCFNFLNAPEIFYSFDELNYHFYTLIRNIPLYLNFQHVPKTIFDQFCTKMLLNSKIKQQIYSLKLSNIHIHCQIELFLSYFSLDEFIHLQLLSLIGITKTNMEKIQLMLPLIPKLNSIQLINSEDFRQIEMPMIEILSIPRLINQNRISTIINLTLSYYTYNELNKIFQYLPMLKYLYIQYHSLKYILKTTSSDTNRYSAIHLKKLIINKFPYTFENLKLFLEQTSNLENLTIIENKNDDLCDAQQWENFITTSLRYLNTFNFIFSCQYVDGTAINKCKEFQSDFWLKKHHWYTAYVIRNNAAFIHTIPYISNICRLCSYDDIYCSKTIDDYKNFYYVKDLTVDFDILSEESQNFFPNIVTLTLTNESGIFKMNDTMLFEKQYIKALKKIVCLSNLTMLDFPQTNYVDLSTILLKILKNTPKLSTLWISQKNLLSLISNDKLCTYLNKTLKKLILYYDYTYLFNDSDELKKFCEIFLNIEQLECHIKDKNHLLYLLNHLPKLSLLIVYFPYYHDYISLVSWFKYEASKLNVIFETNSHVRRDRELRIWIGR